MRSFPPPGVLREVVSNRYFLSRVYGFAGALDLEAILEVADESFQSYDALRHEHGDKASQADAVESDDDADEDDEDDDIPDFDQLAERGGGGDDDDDDAEDADEDGGNETDELVEQRLTVPLYLPRGFIWEIEHYDNGEDAGVVHRIREPGAEPVRFATLDAHPSGHSIGWEEALQLFRAIAVDPRNRAANVSAIAPLLWWSAIRLVETDDREAVRACLAEAWRQVVSRDVADQLAIESSRRRASSQPQPAPLDAFVRLLAALS